MILAIIRNMDGSSFGPGRRDRPVSPCIGVCRLDDSGLCAGCLRSAAEIGEWMRMSAPQQWALLAELAIRRSKR